MAARTFTIVELVKQAVQQPGITDGAGFASSGVRFDWSAAEQSSPRGSWSFGIKLRTVRDDYPGADEPVEQVLGANFTPFTLEGIWDDRYMGSGRAGSTWRSFEALAQRGNPCRFEMEDVSITGLITDVDFTWFRSFRIGYRFTVSPHYRLSGGDARRNRQIMPAAAVLTPQDYSAQINALVTQAIAAHAKAPKAQLKPDVIGDFDVLVRRARAQAELIASMILLRAPTPGAVLPPVKRFVQGFEGMQSVASNLSTKSRSAVLSDLIVGDDPIVQLALETWIKDLSRRSILLAKASAEAASDLRQAAQLGALAFYLPHEGESLYGISTRFYGTPHEWRRIAERNGITSFVLDGTKQLAIPSLS